MSQSAVADRASVRKFFSFHLDKSEIKRRSPKYSAIIGFGILAAIAAGLATESTEGAVAPGVVMAVIVFLIDRALANRDLRKRREDRDRQQREFEKLADETRRVQGSDVVKSFLRVFERTQLSRDQDLVVLDQRYIFEKEKDLFDEERLEERIGDLLNKSIRLISKGSHQTNERLRKIRWKSGRIETFFNPTRLVALFLTPSQLVICDVQIDSIDGDLKEEIQRIALNKIVSLRFSAARARTSISKTRLVQMARDLDVDEKEIHEMERALDTGDPERDWVYEDATSLLEITRTDGGSLSVPIRSDVYFGKHVSALDQDTTLTPDEIAVDRMVNQLNRLVEGAR